MTRTPPNTPSSMIKNAGYDPATQRLEVEFFATGNVYIYRNVPQEVFDALMSAPSAGKYFNANIAKKYTRLA